MSMIWLATLLLPPGPAGPLPAGTCRTVIFLPSISQSMLSPDRMSSLLTIDVGTHTRYDPWLLSRIFLDRGLPISQNKIRVNLRGNFVPESSYQNFVPELLSYQILVPEFRTRIAFVPDPRTRSSARPRAASHYLVTNQKRDRPPYRGSGPLRNGDVIGHPQNPTKTPGRSHLPQVPSEIPKPNHELPWIMRAPRHHELS